MKYLKRLFLLQFLLLFIIPTTFADITITLPEKEMYNLGEKIVPVISIKQENDYDGFFKLYISCDNYDLQYYTIPLNLEAGLRTQLTVPELSLSKSMTTKCRLKSNFESTDGEKIDTEWSKDFFVTDKVNMVIEGNFEAKPGEDILLFGEIRKQSNELMSKGEAKISFKGNEETVDVVNGEFKHVIHLSSDAEAGNIPIIIAVTDRYGNYGDQSLRIKILPIPTRIENSLENNILMPGDTLKARVVIYDHTNKAINGSRINVKIFAPDEKLMAEKDIQSLNYFEFKTEKTQTPGKYRLLSTFEDVEEQSTFQIESVRKIIMNQEGYFVHIENVGNVDYKDEVTIILESDDKNYLINKKIDLEPGEKITIDLSKEVPRGIYDITLPENLVEEPAAEEVNDISQSKDSIETSGPVNVIKDVPIDDNRNVIKKTADSMSIVTGAVAGAAGYVASRPVLASVILILIILGTVTRYSWGFIKNRVKGKKEDNTSNLFEDFKFDEEKK
jgi:hypothetical protein